MTRNQKIGTIIAAILLALSGLGVWTVDLETIRSLIGVSK